MIFSLLQLHLAALTSLKGEIIEINNRLHRVISERDGLEKQLNKSQVQMSFTNNLQSNLPMRSPLLSSHLYENVTFFLSCHRKDHMNWTSFKRSPVLKDHFALSQSWPLNTGLTVFVRLFHLSFKSYYSTCICNLIIRRVFVILLFHVYL